jgi:hypothetical protein
VDDDRVGGENTESTRVALFAQLGQHSYHSVTLINGILSFSVNADFYNPFAIYHTWSDIERDRILTRSIQKRLQITHIWSAVFSPYIRPYSSRCEHFKLLATNSEFFVCQMLSIYSNTKSNRDHLIEFVIMHRFICSLKLSILTWKCLENMSPVHFCKRRCFRALFFCKTHAKRMATDRPRMK